MLTADGCRGRRRRLLDRLRPAGPLLLADPVHLRYLTGFHVEPFCLGADFGGLLLLTPDGHATLFHDDRLPKSAAAHVDERSVLPWYAGQEPGRGPRGLVLRQVVERHGGRVHDSLTDPLAPAVFAAVGDLRRKKDADELGLLRACMRATDAGHAWAREHVRPGTTELDAYNGVARVANEAAGAWVVTYGDFVVCPGPGRRTGPPTTRVLQPGELFILDFSVVIGGYRSDFTNTLAVGGRPSAEQRRMFDLCVQAMAAGEAEVRAGVPCQVVYDAVRRVFADAGTADAFPHHAGHGLGAAHPEPPYVVRNSTETLEAGDVITLEPGLYADGVGGVRIEHNYHVTAGGFERLSGHTIALA